MVVHSVGVRLSDRSAASHVPLSKDGVAFRLTAVWNCVLEPWTASRPRIQRAFSLKSITRVGSFTKGQTVKLSSLSNVKRKDVYRVRIRIPLISVAPTKRVLDNGQTGHC